MSFQDEPKDNGEGFGDKVKESFGAAKEKAEDVIENVKDRLGGDDKPTVSDEPGSYSTEAAPDAAQGTQAAASEATDSAAASVAETAGATQGSAGSLSDAPGETEPGAAAVPDATEPAASSVDEALGAQEAPSDRRADS